MDTDIIRMFRTVPRTRGHIPYSAIQGIKAKLGKTRRPPAGALVGLHVGVRLLTGHADCRPERSGEGHQNVCQRRETRAPRAGNRLRMCGRARHRHPSVCRSAQWPARLTQWYLQMMNRPWEAHARSSALGRKNAHWRAASTGGGPQGCDAHECELLPPPPHSLAAARMRA